MGHPALEKKKQHLCPIFSCVSHVGLMDDHPPTTTTTTAVPGYAACLRGCLWTPRGREAHLRTVFDVVSFVEAEVTQVVGRRPFAGSARLRGQGQVVEVVRQGAQAIHDVVKGPVRRGALEEIVVQRLMEKKKKNKNSTNISCFWPQILRYYAFHIYFNSGPHPLFLKSGFAEHLETILETGRRVFLRRNKQKRVSNFSQTASNVTPIPSLGLSAPRCIAAISTFWQENVWNVHRGRFSGVHSRLLPDATQTGVQGQWL